MGNFSLGPNGWEETNPLPAFPMGNIADETGLTPSQAAENIKQPRGARWQTFVPGGGNAPDLNTGSIGYTHHAVIELPSKPLGIRIPVFNFDTTSARTTDNVAVAFGDGSSVLGSALTYTQLSFSGSASVLVPIARTLNGRVYPGVVLSDPMYGEGIPSAADATKYLVYVRMYKAADKVNWSVWQTSGAGANGWEEAGSRKFFCRYQSGNFTLSNQVGMTDNTVRAFSPVFGVQYLSAVSEPMTLMCFGDSITRGTIDANKAWHYKAVKAANLPNVDYASFGTSSATADEFATHAEYILPLFKPSHAVFPVWTPNDGPTAAGITNQKINLRRFLAACETNQVTPVLWTGTPRSTGANTTPYYTGPEDAARLALIADGITAAFRVVDTLPYLSTLTAPAAYLAGMTGDGLHPTTAGHTAAAIPWQAFIAAEA